jgi:hypothetical protein
MKLRSSVISGNIIVHLGIPYLYIISFCVMAVILGFNIVFMRETTYSRPQVKPQTEKPVNYESDMSGETLMTPTGEARNSAELGPTTSENSMRKEETIDVEARSEPKKPWTAHLRLWHGRVSERNFFKALLRPIPLMIFPSVLFSTIVNGAMLTWVVISSIISGQVLLYPPYNLRPDTLAYLSLPLSGAALISSLISGIASDWQIKYMARKNGGVYEPEFRLLMLIPAVVISTVGFLLLGPLYNRQAPVYQIVLANVLFSVAMPFGSSACTTYILDTMQNSASEAFVATTLFKSLYMFLATFYVPGWFATNGPVVTYRALAILNVGFGLAAIPMYMFGKRWRAVTSRSAFLRKAAGHDIL